MTFYLQKNKYTKSTYVSHLRDFASEDVSEFTSDDVDSSFFGSCSGSGLGVSTNVDGCGCDGSAWGGDGSDGTLFSSISPSCANSLNKIKYNKIFIIYLLYTNLLLYNSAGVMFNWLMN